MKKIMRKAIEAQIVDLLHRTAITGPPVDIEAIAKSVGVPIHVGPLPKDVSGFLHRDGNSALIAVNSKHPRTRQRFTIAHELGHLTMNHKPNQVHVDKNFSIRFRADAVSSDLEETQANFFAAALLMPETFLKRDLQQFQRIGSIDDPVLVALQERYGVSMQALLIRLNTLSYTLTLSV